MKTTLWAVIFFLCALTLPLGAKADTVSMELTGVNGLVSEGYYIDPYYGKVNGLPSLINCVDFGHENQLGDRWTAYVTAVDGSDFSHTYLKVGTLYQEMTWLLQQYPSQDETNKAAIQWVIWDISAGTVAHSYLPQYNYWLGETQAHYANGNYAGWQILTDIQGESQEFVRPVPEPATLLLLGAGLAGLWGVRKKFRNWGLH